MGRVKGCNEEKYSREAKTGKEVEKGTEKENRMKRGDIAKSPKADENIRASSSAVCRA